MPYPTQVPALEQLEVLDLTLDPDVRGRAAEDGLGDGEDDERIWCTFSSERKAKIWEDLIQVLGHDEGEIDMELARNGLPLVIQHARFVRGRPDEAFNQVGIVEDVQLKGRKLGGWMRFMDSPVAQQMRRDVLGKFRKTVSVGYVPIKVKEVEARTDKQPGVYRATRWQPREVALTANPADPSVGVGRAAGDAAFPVEVVPATQQEESPMPEPVKPTQTPAAEPASPAPAATAPAVEVGRSAGDAERQKEMADIVVLCESHGRAALAAEFIRGGLSLKDAKARLLDVLTTRDHVRQPGAEQLDGLSGKDRKRYSYARALQLALAARESGARFDGVEGEVHQHLMSHRPEHVQYRGGGILLPLSTRSAADDLESAIRWEERRALGARAMGSTIAGAGGETVFDRPGELIDILRPTSVCLRRGARLFSGLTAPVQFPKITADPVVRWVGENPAGAVAPSQLGTGIVQLSPKTMQGAVPIPRQLLILSSIDVEMEVRRRLGIGHGLALDYAGLHGLGTAFEPLGVYGTPGVQTYPFGGAPDYVKLVDMTSAIDDVDAAFGSLGWAFTSKMARRLARILEASAAGSRWIWNGSRQEGEVAGDPATASNQLSKTMTGLARTGGAEHGIVYGKWDEMVFGLWGAVETTVDPYTLADYGQVKVTTFQMGDSAIQRAQAFVVGTGATLPA